MINQQGLCYRSDVINIFPINNQPTTRLLIWEFYYCFAKSHFDNESNELRPTANPDLSQYY